MKYALVAQLVEQWPLKPLVEGSSPSGCTRRENQVPLIETLGKYRGFSVSILIITYQKWETLLWETPMGV